MIERSSLESNEGPAFVDELWPIRKDLSRKDWLRSDETEGLEETLDEYAKNGWLEVL